MKTSISPFLLMIMIVCFATDIAFAFDIRTATIYRTAGDAVLSSLPGLPPEDDFSCGDVNQNGLVNVLDIISLVNHIMGGNPNPFDLNAADINADGGIDVLDIIALVNIIMEVPGIPCPCNPTVDYEGQVYNTVQIEGQCWFRENLNIGTMILSNAGGQLQTNNGTTEKYCYDNNISNCDIYGGLYEWNEAMQYDTTEAAQGLCPVGWHIPADNEWKILEGTVDTQYPVGDPEWDGTGSRGFDAGGNLKETGTIHWAPPNVGATNSSGFTALPSGYRFRGNGGFTYIPYGPYFWSSSLKTSTSVWYRSLFFLHTMIDRGGMARDEGYAVRCIKD